MATCFFIECNDVLAKKEKKTNDELKLNYSRYPVLDQANNKGHHALCNEHGIFYAISSDFGDRMTTQSMRLMFLLSEHF